MSLLYIYCAHWFEDLKMSHSLHQRVRNKCQEAGNHLRFFVFLDCTEGFSVQDCHTLRHQPRLLLWLPVLLCGFLCQFSFLFECSSSDFTTNLTKWNTRGVDLFYIYPDLFTALIAHEYHMNTWKGVDFCGEGENSPLFLKQQSLIKCVPEDVSLDKQATCKSFDRLSDKCQHCPMETVLSHTSVTLVCRFGRLFSPNGMLSVEQANRVTWCKRLKHHEGRAAF